MGRLRVRLRLGLLTRFFWLTLSCFAAAVWNTSAQEALSVPHTDFRSRLQWTPEGSDSNLVFRAYGFARLDFQKRTLFNDGTADSSLTTWRSSRCGACVRQVGIRDDWAVNGRVEYDFRGGSQAHPSPRLRHAYMEVENADGWSLLGGQAYDAWYLRSPTLLTSIYPVNRRPQVRLSKVTDLSEKTRLTARIAAVKNQSNDIDDSHANSNGDAKRSLIQSAVMLSRPLLTDRPAHVALAGSYGRERNMFPDCPEEDGLYDTRFLIVYGALPLCSRLVASGSLYTGENMDTVFLGGAARGVNSSSGHSICGTGGWAQCAFYCSSEWRLNAGYSFLERDKSDLSMNDRNLYECYAVNTAYFILPRVQVVFEGNLFREQRVADTSNEHVRLQCSIYYFF